MLTISTAEILARFKFDNPWWEVGNSVESRFSNLPRRTYFSPFHTLVRDASVNRAVVVMGPRRVGKTVLVFHAIQALLEEKIPGNSIFYVSLETPIYTGIPLEKMVSMFQEQFIHRKEEKLFIFFDEIQYLREWEVHLKSLVDSYPAYRFVVTGSAAAALKLKGQESGAGRFTDFVLPPLTFFEYLFFIGRQEELVETQRIAQGKEAKYTYLARNIDELNKEFCNYLKFGGYPEAVMSKSVQEDPGRYIKSDIIDKVLLRDLPSLYGITDIQELNRLFTTLAYNTGNEISLEALSQTAGVAKNTIKRYLEYLEAAFLIRRVNRIDKNAKRFLRATTFKVYLTNPSMKSALFGEIDENGAAIGHLVETAIFSQWQHSRSTSLHYARWKSGEVDIVSLDSSTQRPVWIVEVKWSDRAVSNLPELDNCVEFAAGNHISDSKILVTTKTIAATKEYRGITFEFIPSSVYAYTLGANILRTQLPNSDITVQPQLTGID